MLASPRNKAMTNGGPPLSPNGSTNGSSNGSSNGNGYRKYEKKVSLFGRSKLWWYTVTAVMVVTVVYLAMDKDATGVGTKDNVKTKNIYDSVAVKKTRKPRKIQQISILGERNSGTRWTWGHLSSCFNHTIPVKRSLTRYKHWFQNDNATRYKHDTLVIAQFRNPYDWIEAMRKVPHHSPAHIDLEWNEFCTKPWTTERIGGDLNITDKETFDCQEKFQYKDIVSCLRSPLPKSAYKQKLRYSENQPFYEMRNDGSGLPYDNILELRSDKIRNFMQVKEYEGVRDLWVTQYEYLLAKGTKGMLDKISEWTGVEYKCDPFPIQNRRRRPVSKDFAEYLNKHLDWEAEAMAGYTKELVEE